MRVFPRRPEKKKARAKKNGSGKLITPIAAAGAGRRSPTGGILSRTPPRRGTAGATASLLLWCVFSTLSPFLPFPSFPSRPLSHFPFLLSSFSSSSCPLTFLRQEVIRQTSSNNQSCKYVRIGEGEAEIERCRAEGEGGRGTGQSKGGGRWESESERSPGLTFLIGITFTSGGREARRRVEVTEVFLGEGPPQIQRMSPSPLLSFFFSLHLFSSYSLHYPLPLFSFSPFSPL
jgi:hypothetical protein